jgi:predicted metal-dependent hydrolase
MVTPEVVEYQGILAEVVRTSRQKTASLRVDGGVVSIVAPRGTSSERLQGILRDKQAWLRGKLVLQREALPAPSKVFVSGEAFPYLGRNYRLKVIQGSYAPVKLVQGRLVATVPKGNQDPDVIRRSLVSWYHWRAQAKLQEKTGRYAKQIGVSPKSVSIKGFQSRWGSCSAKGEILFNWRIIMAPNRIGDYIVVHELCHLLHHDHGPNFWKAVERVLPDYVERKEWLKGNGAGRYW